MYLNGSEGDENITNGCDGCRASLQNGSRCGETETLKILREFHKLYEDKLKKIDDNDEAALQMKTLMLQDWVRDLTEQNTMLVQAVEELEKEATERVALLETKLKQSSKASYEVMKSFQSYDRFNDKNSTFCVMNNYQSDINNLLEFIRRIREDGLWSIEGLHFYEIGVIEEFIGKQSCSVSDLPVIKRSINEDIFKYKSELEVVKKEEDMHKREIKMKDMIIQDQLQQIKNLEKNVDDNSFENDNRHKLLDELHSMKKELKLRSEEYEKLERSMKDMREALTAEVADKHDNIMALRRECHMLEEQCRQADKQTHFKDDIIKDMRKELKHLRSKLENEGDTEVEDLRQKVAIYEKENENFQKVINEKSDQLLNMHKSINKFNKEQNEIIDHFRNKINVKSASEMLISKPENNVNVELNSLDRLTYSIDLMKTDVEQLISLRSNEEIKLIIERYDDFKSNLTESKNKEELIKTKDEMIHVQNDTLNIAQMELKELQLKISNLEEEHEKKIQETKHLQQDLKISQDIIAEMENNSKIAEEKMKNMQQATGNQLLTSKNDVLEDIVKFLKNEMSQLSNQLQILHDLLKVANNVSAEQKDENLTQSIILLEERSELLVHQLKVTKEQISREIKINEINKARIEELEKQLENKSLELYHCEGELSSLKAALDDSLQINQEFERKVRYMQKQVSEYEQQQLQYDAKIGDYQSDISNLNSNVVDMRFKVQNLSDILKIKTDELLRLRAELSVKCDAVNSLAIENDHLRTEFEEQKRKLNSECSYLRTKLITYKSSFVDINQKYSKCQSVLIEGTEREMKFQQEQLEQRAKLNNELRFLQTENTNLNNDIKALNKQIEELKFSLQQYVNISKDYDASQEEVLELKNELNCLTQAQSTLQTENEKLSKHISTLTSTQDEVRNDNKRLNEKVNQCLQDITSVQSAKDKLEERNLQLEVEIESLQRTYSDLNREVQYKNESVLNLEQELTEARLNRDELRAESKRVVSNVRFWLQEQKQINQQLKDSIREKNSLIEELNNERNALMKNVREMYDKYNSLSEELQVCQQHSVAVRAPSMKRSIYTWGSQGSITQESPSSSPSTMDEHVFEYEDMDGKMCEMAASPIMWMEKVKNISAELQRNNQYWKKKLQQSRKYTPPVKDVQS